jgi:ABC-type antimicrobial peptide transport system permease subunit
MPENQLSFWASVKSYTQLSARYTFADVTKRPRNFCIGFWSVFTVVFFVGLLLTALAKTPVIFLRFAELSVGEMDTLILAEGSLPFINYTAVQPAIDGASSIEGSTPRWLLKGEVSKFVALNASNNTPTMATNVIVIDSKKEKDIGVGRQWPYRQIGYGEVQVYHSALRFIDTAPNIGQRMKLIIDVAGILQQQNVSFPLGAFNATTPTLNTTGVVPTNADGTVPVNLTGLAPLFGGANLGVVNVSAAAVAALQNNTVAADGVNSQIFTQFLSPELKLVAADAIQQTYAKYPAALGNAVVLDFHDLLPLLLDQICYSNLQQPFTSVLGPAAPNPFGLPTQEQLLSGVSLEYFTLVTVGMFRDRFSTYYLGREERNKELIRKSDLLFLSLGVDFAGSVQYPISAALGGFYFFQLFLGSLFQAVAVVIAVLGALLVYTLLLTNSEEKSFEVAIMRSQGMYRSQLAHLLVFQSAVFIVPAVAVGIGFLLVVNAILEVALAIFTAAPAEPGRVDTASIVVPIVFGFAVPFAANWEPTKRALLASLRDALDVYRQAASETKVTALKLAELGLEPWQTMLGWFLIISGFTVYYMVPFSFIFDQLWLFFLILNLILLGMLFGLCLISYSIEGYVQRGALWLLLWGSEKRLWTLIIRNLGSHKERNSKAYMMFTVSVACIIFGGVLFTLLSGSIGQTIETGIGADVVVQSLLFDFPLNQSDLTSFLLKQQQLGLVTSFAFSAFALDMYPQFNGRTSISNIIGFPQSTQRVVGVSETLFESVFSKFILASEIDSEYAYNRTAEGTTNVLQSMYNEVPRTLLSTSARIFTGFPPNQTVPQVRGKYEAVIPCIMATAAKDVLGLSAGSSGTLAFSYWTGNGGTKTSRDTVFLFQPRALMDKFPGWPLISSLNFAFAASTMLIPMNYFDLLLRPNQIDFPTNYLTPTYRLPTDAVVQVRMEKVFIKVAGWLQGASRTDFVNLLQSLVNPYYHIPFDTADIVRQFKVTADLIIYFFFFVSAVCIILDTFMLWLAFVSNVKLNCWSFAVLRSLGFTQAQLVRAYIYEALSIVLGSFFVGTVIGIVIAYTLIVQMNLFLQLPFTFNFPVALFFFLLGLSLVSAVLGSYLPTRSITSRSIATVLKSGD